MCSSGNSFDCRKTITAQTGTLQFALPMQAGFRYTVRVHASDMTGPTGALSIAAYEEDADGNVVATYGPASSDAELASCGEPQAPARH